MNYLEYNLKTVWLQVYSGFQGDT